MSLRKLAINSLRWTSGATVITAILQIFQLLIISRILTPEDFGLMAIVNIIIMFMKLFSDFGISQAIVHFQDTNQQQISTIFFLNILIGIGLFVLTMISAPFFSWIYGEEILSHLIIVLSFSLLMNPIGAVYQAIFQRDLKFNILFFQEVLSAIFGVSVTVYLAFEGYGVWSLVYGQLVNSFIRNTLVAVIGFRSIRITFDFQFKKVRKYISFGVYQMGERGVNFLSQRIDQLVIGGLVGIEELGYYNFAYNLVIQPVQLFNPIFTKVAFPILAKLQNNLDQLKRSFYKLLSVILSVNVPILIGLVITAELLIPLVFDEKWQGAIVFIQILSFVAIVKSFFNPVGSLVLAKGRSDLGFKWNTYYFILVTLTIIFSGISGSAIIIAWAILVLHLLTTYPFYSVLIDPLLKTSYFEWISIFFKPVVIALFMALTMLFISFINLNEIILLISQIILGIITYFTFFYFFDKDNFNDLKEFLINK